MFCPKCGTQNPENGKYCRKCGTDLRTVSDALTGKISSGGSNNFGMIKPIDPMQFFGKKGKPISYEQAITKIFSGLAFLIVALILGYTNAYGGRLWWFWMLIPAFGSLGSGVAQLIQLRKIEKGKFVNSSVELPDSPSSKNSYNELPPTHSDFIQIQDLINSGKKIEAIKIYRETTGAGLKDAKVAVERIKRGELTYPNPTTQLNDYTPPKGSVYDTGELQTPPSVTEGTTRLLELNNEGETMTLPPKV